MFKKRKGLLIIFLILCFAGCSKQDSEQTSKDRAESSSKSMTEEKMITNHSDTPSGEETAASEGQENDKMMVYEAHIGLETKDYNEFYRSLEKQMSKYDAYMVETSIQKTERGNRQGHITLRVPQQHFDSLLSGFNEISENIKSRNINSRDVTKDFVDLESRLKAKEEIEARLLSFLEEADATEDLINISKDLERVQSEIETIKGEMNYLENQSEYSTITVSIEETKVVVPDVESQDLDTWQKTKQAFFSSLNGIASFFSWFTIFIIGYSPIILPLLGVLVFFWWRKRKKIKHIDPS